MKNRVRIKRKESPIQEVRVGDQVDDDETFRGISLRPFHGTILGGYYRSARDSESHFMGDFGIEPEDVDDLCVALQEMKRIVERS